MKANLLIITVLAVLASIALAQAEDSDCGQLKSIGECSSCCAINGFNRFNHTQFLESQTCDCYSDEAEIKFNGDHRPKHVAPTSAEQ